MSLSQNTQTGQIFGGTIARVYGREAEYAENSRVYEYRVGLQFRSEGFINPAACLFEDHFEMIISSLEKCTLRGKMSSEKC